MSTMSGAVAVWRRLMRAQVREQPGRLAVTVLAIALGVSLGASVYLVNGAALNEFGLATKRLVGESDLVIRGPKSGFAEDLFTNLALDPAVGIASPLLELDVALHDRADTLKVLGLDVFRAAALQPALLGDVGQHLFDLFAVDSIFLSGSAAQSLHVGRGDSFEVTVGSSSKILHVIGILSQEAYPEPLGIMDIASAQWAFAKLGVLNRIDLRLAPGTDVETFRRSLPKRLPAGVQAVAPQVELDRAVTVTRAYRLNLNMLALVALFTGAFLVFSTQSLAVQRRRRTLALLRALGVTAAELRIALLGEGALLGAVGSLFGILLGIGIAAGVLHFLNSDLGNGQLRSAGAALHPAPLALAGFVGIGLAVAGFGAWFPARRAARIAPARALKGGGQDASDVGRSGGWPGLALLLCGAALTLVRPVSGLPLFGYAAVAALLFGAVLLVPSVTTRILRLTPRTHLVILDTTIAQLRENVRLFTLSLASIIVSFSLMVAMAVMVYSFRVSFEHWLGKLLPADLQLREPYGNDTAFWSAQDQDRLAATPGVRRAEFRRTQQVLVDAARPSVTLIARGADAAQAAAELPLIGARANVASALPAAWISEAFQVLYGYHAGDELTLALAQADGTSVERRFSIAGVWRDYARTSGAVVVTRTDYVRMTGDGGASEGSLWLEAGADAQQVIQGLHAAVANGASMEIMLSTALHERSLRIFDRAFAITYALELIAVLIGLTGVSFAASSAALARRADFGVLRHIGMRRRQIVGMLAGEGILTSLFGVAYGLCLGIVLSLVLVYVINRQSFNWSIDLAFPGMQLAILSATLIAAATLTAVWSGRAAMGEDAVRSVREDW
jgi:putative ABC transport system permease protein